MKDRARLVIVGGGFAGMIAACRAAELGLRSAVIERGGSELYPCNSRYSGGLMHVSYKDPALPPEQLLAAINEITMGMAVEFADKGIRCNAVAPGTVLTEGTAGHYGTEAARAALK